MKNRRFASVLCAIGALAFASGLVFARAEGAEADEKAYEELSAKIQQQPYSVFEDDVTRLFDLGDRLSRPVSVSIVIKSYLARQQEPSLTLLKKAIENAFTVGNFRTAVARCKDYLKRSTPNTENSDIAAGMYSAQIDFLNAPDDAYRFMAGPGKSFRKSIAARKFDEWFMRRATHVKDYAGLAQRLELVFSDRIPVEMEKAIYGGYLNRLASELVSPSREKFEAAPNCRSLISAIRDEKQKARLAFLTENLAFKAASSGKDSTALNREFEKVTAAAEDYMNKSPSAKTLIEIIETFSEGDPGAGWSEGHQVELKRDLVVKAFAKLPSDEEAKRVMTWEHPRRKRTIRDRIASPRDWTRIAAKRPSVFRNNVDLAVNTPFFTETGKRNIYEVQSKVLKNTPSGDAAAIKSIAAGTNLDQCVDHLVNSESWYLYEFGDAYELINEKIIPAVKKISAAEGKKISEEDITASILRFGSRYAANSPLAFDTDTAEAYMDSVWKTFGTDRAIVKHLQSLSWVPYTEKQCKEIYEQPYQRFRREADDLGKKPEQARRRRDELVKKAGQAKKAGKNIKELAAGLRDVEADLKKMEKQLAQISEIDAAFRKALDPASVNIEAAPSAMCKELALAVKAAREDDKAVFIGQAKKLYARFKDYDEKKEPFGRRVMRLLLDPPGDMDVIDLQCAILANQLKHYKPGEENFRVHWMVSDILHSRPQWSPRRYTKEDKSNVLKLNKVFAAAVSEHMKKGKFPGRLFGYVLDTRRSENRHRKDRWHDRGMNSDLMIEIIEKDALAKSSYRPDDSCQMAACACMWLARNEFSLPEKYSLDRYFDDMFVKEAERGKLLDYEYWSLGGRDKHRKVRDAAARLLASGEDVNTDNYGRWHRYALDASEKPRNKYIEKLESQYGKTRFDEDAMGYLYFRHQADPSKPEGRKKFFDRLSTVFDRMADVPRRCDMPYMGGLRNLDDPDNPTEGEMEILERMFAVSLVPPEWDRGHGYEYVVYRMNGPVLSSGDPADAFRAAPHFWKIARDSRDSRLADHLVRLSENLLNEKRYDLAVVYSSIGQDLLHSQLSDVSRNALSVVKSRALTEVGGVIPVDRSDPRYPLFAAQRDYFGGNVQRAWDNYMKARDLVTEAFQELDPSFCTWLIGRHTEIEQFEEAEDLARRLIQWQENNPSRVSPEVRAEVMLAYANIAFRREEYPKAKALYEKIAATAQFEGLRVRTDAQMKIADVLRVSGQPDEAIALLDKLLRENDRYIQTLGHYHMALVKMDLEQYEEAREHLDRVFALDPNHAEARILEGKINLNVKQIERTLRLREIGALSEKKTIVPGKPLQIGIEDRVLSVVGNAVRVEIRAWTDSGDEEIFNLLPFADSRTRFEGEVATALAPPSKNDGVLQVLGEDKVHYDFSEKFKKAQQIEDAVTHTLTVVSDSDLFASSGRILSEEEREQMAIEEAIRERLRKEGAIREKMGTERLSLRMLRPGTQVRPGNKINVRVVDYDRSVTSGKDSINVEVSTSSGDRILAFPLYETETHSGVFEGAVPTEAAPAVAYATDSDEGADPNYTISKGDHPPWVALKDNMRPKTFAVDLNDSRFLGKLDIHAGITGRKLKDFLVQISGNGTDFTTVGAWPEALPAWDGSPRGVIINAKGIDFSKTQRSRRNEIAARVDIMRKALGNASTRQKAYIRLKNLSAKWNRNVFGKDDDLHLQRHSPSYLARFTGAFYLPERRVKVFELKTENRKSREQVRFVMTVDGKAGTTRDEDGKDVETPHTYKGALKKGVHVIDVYVTAERYAEPSFHLLSDSEEPPYREECPADMFDPAKNPRIAEATATRPAEVTAAEDGGSFKVDFAGRKRCRAIRLYMHDFETDAPAIDKLMLTSKTGEKLLPAEADLLSLRQNNILEIIPGDTISISYKDPVCLSENRRVREAFLSATYANAELEPCFIASYGTDKRGMREAEYITMRRFKPGDTVNILIDDPDGDVSEKKDKILYTASTPFGEPIELEAMEQSAHSGVFVGRIFPVEEEPTRKSEIKVSEGDDIIITYLDKENTDPGIPWNRTVNIEQVWYQEPEVRVFDVSSFPVPDEELEKQNKEIKLVQEYIPARRRLAAKRPMSPAPPESTPSAFAGSSVIVEVLWPTIAQSELSKTEIYLQTSAGREAAVRAETEETAPPGETGPPEGAEEIPFDPAVPGTLKPVCPISESSATLIVPPGFSRDSTVAGDRFSSGDPLSDGRFTFSIPLALGDLPEKSLVKQEATDRPREKEEVKLTVKGGDTVYIGFHYTNDLGEARWITREVIVDAEPFFDVMDRRYQEMITGLYVGQSAYFRVIDPLMDQTPDRDNVTVSLNAEFGEKKDIELLETYSHSGVFKGLTKFTYAERKEAAEGSEPVYSSEDGMLAVKYGDTVTMTYKSVEGKEPLVRTLKIFKGADGEVLPFSKRFKDPSIAVRTQLLSAEAYFELAKQHRKLDQKEITRQEIAKGKKLLEEALRQHPDTDARAQADYLLANLAMEFAEESKDPEVRKKFYEEALTGFSAIVSTFNESEYAPKAQYKKALALEKLGEIDEACEEYVKLSYRWPGNELVAETILRLGQYFFRKGKSFTEAVKAEPDPVEKEKIRLKSRNMFKTAGEVFARLAPRFPGHELSGKATLLSGQCFMRAEMFEEAVEAFLPLINDEKTDKDVRAEAKYWCADSYMHMKNLEEAYKQFKTLTWDYPESKWAKFARGQLTKEALAKLEIE
ncbi:MAG: tetratricopeptide repeat protein [Kiritimatiellia bacterium]